MFQLCTSSTTKSGIFRYFLYFLFKILHFSQCFFTLLFHIYYKFIIFSTLCLLFKLFICNIYPLCSPVETVDNFVNNWKYSFLVHELFTSNFLFVHFFIFKHFIFFIMCTKYFVFLNLYTMYFYILESQHNFLL